MSAAIPLLCAPGAGPTRRASHGDLSGPARPDPLRRPRDLALPLAWHGGQPISAAQFIAEAQTLAHALPPGRPVNLCENRYHFALGLGAALLRGQTSLMPPNALPETLRQLPPGGGEPYLLVDDAAQAMAPLRAFRVQRPQGVAPAREAPMIPVDLQAVCLLTSGSTGAPQPHVKCWGPLVANIAAEAQRLAEMLQQPSLAGMNIVATVPVQHSYGFESSVLLAMLGGASFDSGRPFYPADIDAALRRVPEPRALVTTPFHLKTLLRAGLDLPHVALALSATAPLSPQLAAQAEAAFGGPLVEIYGCTEAGQVASRRTTAGLTWRTLGELRVVREGAGGDERFVVSGGHVVDPTPLADVLELQDDRHFRLLGRANDLIHIAGKRSSLAHLNFHLNRIAGVEDGAFWLPDDEAEGVVRSVAFVVAPTLGAAQIVAALRGQIEGAFLPRRVVHVDALPREATGKLTAAALRGLAMQQLAPLRSATPCDAAPGPEPRSGSGWKAESEFVIAPDHPAFAGHFPGEPVLPGAVLLSLTLMALASHEVLAARLGACPSVDSAKFLHAVGPGARLRVAFQENAGGVAFEIRTGVTRVARGQCGTGMHA